ncbi:helix-turn-helix domain-containing protein [Paraburkholderia sp. WP4_3_2]|nr:helix-turn-helix domain-containing protein [Paraburkholderia sp. WP4_3_2]MBB3257528.1 transcriptional regulator with XRE-family HTH domain [Paraburkholderia sp. WP4_3_2]
MAVLSPWFSNMEFPERLTALRKARGLTQLALAEAIDLSVLQIRRYESGNSQPTLDVIRRLAVALGVSSDALVFDEGERGPDDVLRYQFETIARMPEQEQQLVRGVLDALILKNQVAGAMARVTESEKQPARRTRKAGSEEKRSQR